MRLSEMVGRRLREGGYFARTIQLKLRYKDFTTITRAHSLEQPTQIDREIFEQARRLFLANWKKGAAGAVAGRADFELRSRVPAQLEPAGTGARTSDWQKVLAAADHLRDKFGESTIGLATGMKGSFRERTHENPVGLPGKMNVKQTESAEGTGIRKAGRSEPSPD